MRSNSSARRAGARFEKDVADYLAWALMDRRIERRAKCGAKDRGDVTGVMFHGERVVIECKDCARPRLPEWLREAEEERGNDDALYGVVVHKRHGVKAPADQYVTMTLQTFGAFLAGGSDLLPDTGDQARDQEDGK